MKNTIMNLLDSINTFISLVTQPNANIAHLDVLVRLINQRVSETAELVCSMPSDNDMLALIGYMNIHVCGASAMVEVIGQLHGEESAIAFIETMEMLDRAKNGLNSVMRQDQVAQAERAMNLTTH